VKFAEKKIKSWQSAIIYLVIWLIVTAGLKLIADDLIGSLLIHVMYVMIMLPLADFVIPFIYTRKHGFKPWLAAYMAAAVAVLYFGFGYSELSPDFLATALLCGFFGFGLGNVLKDEAAVAMHEDIDSERKKRRLAAEKRYVSLLDSDPKTGKRANLRKKKKRS
jgi:hypothetical protein